MVAVFGLTFVSCGEDDEDEPNNGSGGTSEQFSFTINGKNYYYGRTYTWPGVDLKESKTYCGFSPISSDSYGHSLFYLSLNAYDMPYSDLEDPFGFHEYNSEVECDFMLIDFDPSKAKQGDVFGFKQVVKEVYNGVVYDIYNTIKYREKSQGTEKSITFSWNDDNPQGRVKFISYKKIENDSYLLTMEFQNVTMKRITDNSLFSNKAEQLVLNGKIMFTDIDNNPTGQIN